MTIVWKSDPSFKIEISGETFINDESLTILNKRIENNLSYLVLQIDDYKSKNYIDVFDTFDSLILSLRYGSDAWSKVFAGKVTTAKPHLSIEKGEVLEVGAWDRGKALPNTHCDESYGVESLNNTAVVTPKQILDDLITEHINKEFGGVASGYVIVSEVDNVHAGLSVTYLNSQYLDNFVNVNRICDLVNAYAGGIAEVSIHWFVDPDKKLMVKKIDANHSSATWPRYYGGSQVNATIEVAKDMILYDFAKNVEEYANSVLLSTMFRKPSEDYITEVAAIITAWGTANATVVADAVGPPTPIVGTNSLRAEGGPAAPPSQIWYPATANAAWDFTKVGSQNNVPTINFYMAINNVAFRVKLRLFTNRGVDYFEYTIWNDIPTALVFKHFSIPIGPHHEETGEDSPVAWVTTGNPSWANINGIEFDYIYFIGAPIEYFWVDDLHFSGQIMRQARDVAEIAAHDLVQKTIRNDTATNDSLKESDDSGTAAQLAYAELLRRSQIPIVGMIQIPLLVNLLPGQTLHVHACKKVDETFRIDKDMRVKDLRHILNVNNIQRTIVNLTSDVTNSHAFGVPNQYALLKQYAGALANSEARNLKGGAIDNLIPRLSVNY